MTRSQTTALTPEVGHFSRAARLETPSSILLGDGPNGEFLSLRATVEELGYTVVEAHSSQEAIARAQEEAEFAAILLNVSLPDGSGFETVRAIRERGKSRQSAVILLTTSDIDHLQLEQISSLGVADLLSKPILPLLLKAKLRGLVDLVEQKQQVQREAEQLRMLVHGTSDYAIFMLDPEGNIITWNSGAERLKGYKADEIIGQHFSRFYPHDAIERGWPQHELKVAGAEGRFEDEGWRLRKDGSRFWANVVITALRGERGELRGFSKITRDLTRRKEAEEALRQSEERFRLLVESAQDYAIFLLDPQGHIASWNTGAQRIKQYRSDEIIGQHFSKFYTPEAIERGWPNNELELATRLGRFEDEGWRVRKDGTRFWANVIITALHDEAGRLRGFSKITRDMTDRKKAEDNVLRLIEETTARRIAEENAHLIQQQRQRLHVTLASIGDGVISTDADGRVEFLNPVAEHLTGWTGPQAVGEALVDVFHIVHEETRESLPNPALQALSEGRVAALANRALLISKDGSERPIDDSAAPIRSNDGTVIGSVLVFREISERRRNEAQLREQQEWLRVTLESIGDAVIATDTEGRVTLLNTVASRITGWSQSEAQGRLLSSVFPVINEQSRQFIENPVQQVLRDGRTVGSGVDTVLIAKDGSERPIDQSAAPILNDSGKMIGVVLIFRDVTEQRRAEEELRTSNARKSAILETSLDCIISMDHGGRIVDFNPAAEQTFGYRREDVIGKDLSQTIIPPALRQQHRQGMAHYLRTGIGPVLGKRLELPALRSDGSEFPAELSITRIPSEGPPLFTAYLRDLTEQKRAERYRTLRLAITQALAEAVSVTVGAEKVLQAVCENLEWEIGFFWTLDKEETSLVCLKSWHSGQDVALRNFDRASGTRKFARGEGLPGTTWVAGESKWILDVNTEENFPRKVEAAQAGLRSAFVSPIIVADRVIGVIEFFSKQIREPDAGLLETIGTISGHVAQFLERRRAEENLRQQSMTAETLYRIGSVLAAELDLHRLVQIVTDEGTKLTGAQFGAFFYNVVSDNGEAYTLYTLSGVSREAFSQFPMPRNTELFRPTFRGEKIVRSDDVLADPHYGKHPPYYGMPKNHLPVRSYLALPVVSRTGEVLGGLFFGHADVGVFTEHHERLLSGVAGQAAVAIDNARLYQRTQATAERLNLALAAARLGDWSWDAVTDVVNLSPRAAEIFGIAPDPQLTWTQLQELLHEDDREFARQEVQRSIQERVQYDIEYRVNRPDGAQVWVAALGRSTHNAAGEVLGMYGVVSDISGRKRLEKSLRESEGRFRGLMEQAPFGVQIFSPEGRTLRVNRAWEGLWGITLDELQDYNILSDPQLEQKGVLPFIRRAFEGEAAHIPATHYNPSEHVSELKNRIGSTRWVESVAYPLKDESGTVREVVMVYDDITARKRAEEARRQSEGLYRAIGESIDYGVWVCDPQGRNIYASDSFLRLVGMTQEECSEFGWSTVLHPDDAERTIAAWKECVRTGSQWDVEHRFKGADGQWHFVLARGVPVRNERGEITAWAGINLDIQRLKQVEAELRAADRRKDEFLATLAHELRNPLAPIRNSLQILSMPRIDAATAQQARDMMERQLHHLVRLVDDLLDVSRVMRGKIELRKEPVELATIVARAVEIAKPLIEIQGHRLEISLSSDSLLLDADPVRLAQVVGNLLTNAAKYTDAKGHIWLSAAREENEAVLRVRDDGIGIAPDMLPHIFDLFVQADHAFAKAQGGLGIGLTLVKNLVEMHNGRVKGHSAGLGTGSEFVVRLPLATLVTQPVDEKENIGAGEGTPPSGYRLLVVDDNQDAAISLAMLLRIQGHDVRVVHDGAAALSMVETYVPDIVFLDLGMPVMDGYEVARRMRRMPGLQHTILAALTGWGQEEDRRRTAEAGFDYHLVKPPEIKMLDNIIAQLDNRAHG